MTTYQRCRNPHVVNGGVFEMESDSDASKVYKVNMAPPPTCTCIAFAIGRNRAKSNKPVKTFGPQQAWCKHIQRVYDITCSFDSRIHGTSMIPICPLCGNQLEVVETPESTVVSNSSVTPERTVSPDSLLAKLGAQLTQP